LTAFVFGLSESRKF